RPPPQKKSPVGGEKLIARLSSRCHHFFLPCRSFGRRLSGKNTAMCEKSAVDQNLEFFTAAVDTPLSLISRGVKKFRKKYKSQGHHFSVLLSGHRSLE
ncbi:hypothetical protein, partial [Pantoea piersonii]|uniref:hypothetical protein n=1 Tax=Pantoea piersonii TaxID=2364647 RepID=UPI001D6157C5